MVAPDFTDAEHKLSRAREHIAEFERSVARASQSGLQIISLQDKGATVDLVIESTHQIDKAINAIIGDAVGNLRSALDYIAIALSKPITGKTKDVYFPFDNDWKGFQGKVRQARLGPWPKSFQEFFVDEVQAYEGGKGHTLWVLNQLRNIDKHRFLVTVRNIVSVTMSCRVGGMTITDCTFVVTAGQHGSFVSFRKPFDSGGDIEITDQPRAAFDVLLNEAPFIENAPVAGYLQQLASNVETLLYSLKIALKASGP